MFEKSIKKKMLKLLESVKYGEVYLTTPEGEEYHFKGTHQGQTADIRLDDWRTIVNLSLKGDVGFAEDFRDGYWHTDNLASLLIFGLENEQVFPSYINGKFFFRQLSKILYLTKRNSIKGSQNNIEAHYDLGNDFYALWLDPTMTYSSGIYHEAHDTLQMSQVNKYARIIDKLKPHGSVLEVGCGWGGFAEEALKRGDYHYKGITLSKEQKKYADQRLVNFDHAEVVLEDYRHQQGKYDNIVSIEMFEAVGKQYWQSYFDQIKQCLKPDGVAVIQTITVADWLFETYCKSADMIRTFIFPGGMLPSPQALEKHAKKAGLKIKESYSFGHDYAKTLQQWYVNFSAESQALIEMGFDKRFQRMWKFYLAGCVATFITNRTDVVQLEVIHDDA